MSIKNIFTCGTLVSTILLGSCGGGQVELQIVLSSNDNGNVLQKISQDMQIGASAGVFFVLDELKTTPTSVNDLLAGGDTYSEPNVQSANGDDPLQKQFSLSTSSLRAGSFYRIKMIGKGANGATTHTGTGDCPIKLSLKDVNEVKICFGENDPSDPPLCPGLTKFTNCPGI